MADEPTQEPQFLYLTTQGWKSGKPHQVEIWYVAHEECCYLVAEHREKTHWVQNIVHNPAVSFSVGSREAQMMPGTGRIINREAEPELAAAVAALMDAKYDWSDGLIVELKPNEQS